MNTTHEERDHEICAHCDEQLPVCIGRYEDDGPPELACDECCGHGNEDGWCLPIAVYYERSRKELTDALAAIEVERDNARANARAIAHSYVNDSRPLQRAVDESLAYPAISERLRRKEDDRG